MATKLPKVTCKVCNKEMLEMLYQSHVTSHCNEILPHWLYLGAERNTKQLWNGNKEAFTHVISVAEEVTLPKPTDGCDDVVALRNNTWMLTKVGEIYQYHIQIKDLPDQDMSVFTKMAEEIDRLKRSYDGSLKILVHCVQGISRSTSVILAYLIKYNNMTLKDAYYFVRERRPIANPRKEFIGELQRMEKDVFGFEQPTLSFEDTIKGQVQINLDPRTK